METVFSNSSQNTTDIGLGTTIVRYQPIKGTEISNNNNGFTTTLNTLQHCITCMKEYKGKSFEELRYDDYELKCKKQQKQHNSICQTQKVSNTFKTPQHSATQQNSTDNSDDHEKTNNSSKLNEPFNFVFNPLSQIKIECGDAETKNQNQPFLFGSTTQEEFEQFTNPNNVLNNVVGTTAAKYEPTSDTDEMYYNGSFKKVSTKYHCITFLKDYEHNSLDELRHEDYLLKRKKTGTNNTTCSFEQANSSKQQNLEKQGKTEKPLNSFGSSFNEKNVSVFDKNNQINNDLFGNKNKQEGFTFEPFSATRNKTFGFGSLFFKHTTQTSEFVKTATGFGSFGKTNQTQSTFSNTTTQSLFSSNNNNNNNNNNMNQNEPSLQQLSSLLDQKLENIATKDNLTQIGISVQENNHEMENLKCQVKTLLTENRKLNEQLNTLQLQFHKKNLVFKGFSLLHENKDPKEIVEDICSRYFKIEVNIDRAKFIDNYRVIIATFLYENEIVHILKNRIKLRGTNLKVQKFIPKAFQVQKNIIHKVKGLIMKNNPVANINFGIDWIKIDNIKYIYADQMFLVDGENKNDTISEMIGKRVDEIINMYVHL